MKQTHKLIIKSLHDGQAVCTCNGWEIFCCGETTEKHIRQEFQMHLANVRRFEVSNG